DLKEDASGQPTRCHFEQHRRVAGRDRLPPLDSGLSVAELTEVVRSPRGWHAGEHDLGIRRHQPHEDALVAAGRLLRRNRLAQAIDTGAVEAGGVVGQLDAYDLVVPLDQRPLEQPVGQYRDQQRAGDEDGAVPERQPYAERSRDTMAGILRRHQRPACPETSSTYPMPRRVCRSFGSKSWSIFSRKRWTSTSAKLVGGAK